MKAELMGESYDGVLAMDIAGRAYTVIRCMPGTVFVGIDLVMYVGTDEEWHRVTDEALAKRLRSVEEDCGRLTVAELARIEEEEGD